MFYHSITNYLSSLHEASLVTFVDCDTELGRILLQRAPKGSTTFLRYITAALLGDKFFQQSLYLARESDDALADVWGLFLLYAHSLLA